MPSTWEKLARARSLLVATDYDGTLSEIAPSPDAAVPVPGAIEALSELARRPGVTVAVVSGRSASELARRAGAIPGAIFVSEHGARIEAPEFEWAAPAPDPPSLDRLVREAHDLASRHPGVLVEPKSFGVALHVRQLDAPALERIASEAAAWEAAAKALGFDVLGGRAVIEARARGVSKANALERILARMPADTAAVFAGDDTTDDAALALVVRRGGVAVRIASADRPEGEAATFVLGGPRAWVARLAELARARPT